MAVIARSLKRVENQTAPEINRQIRQQTEADVQYYAAHPELIPQRLSELDREWDVERMLQFNSAALSLLGLVLAKRSKKWLLLPIGVQAFFLQHGLQGWCPPLPVFRRAGIRTMREIEIERHALKTIRGDYRDSQGAASAFEAAAERGADGDGSAASLVAPTATRVPLNTESAVNEKIENAAERRLSFLEKHPEGREARQQALGGEWDLERTIEVEAPTMSLAGLALGATLSRKWLAIPLVAQSMMLIHSLQGFYPLLPLLRRLRIRTEDEIATERYAIKALSGDFEQTATTRHARSKGDAAFAAAEKRV